MGANVWWVLIMRAFWFVVGAACVLLGLAVVVQRTTGHEAPAEGLRYQTTVVSSAPIDATGANQGCRLTVDPSGAPEQSNAPTRVRSARPCADLPAAGAPVSLTWVDDGHTVVSDDTQPASERPPLALGVVLLVVGAACGLMFIRSNRAFQRVLDDAGPPPVD